MRPSRGFFPPWLSKKEKFFKISLPKWGGNYPVSKNILVVDDAAFMRMMIKNILTKEGYNVVGEAENGKVAVNLYEKLKPDLVTMDITMPEMDGIEGVKAIRQMDPEARIIMCSAMGQQSMVMEAIQAGAKDFIVKPFQHERILQAIERVLAR
jgi:two-component system chemotaxis response regulator CheY